jgi:DNA ligase-1
MEFSVIARAFERMEKTKKRLELTDILVELFKNMPDRVVSKVVYLLQGIIRPQFEGV